jgi:hypothetical protein
MGIRQPLRRLATAAAAALFFLGLAVRPAAAQQGPRYAHTATMLSLGNILIAGGISQTGAFLNTAELIQTNSGWRPDTATGDILAGPMTVARASHTATYLPNGEVLVAGGINGGGVLNSLEVYNPVTNSWAGAGVMSTPRYNHTATLLDTGNVLICGGQVDLAGTASATCDIFTPLAGGGGSVTGAANLIAARAGHTAVLLQDGTVWFAGGYSSANTYITTSERYLPSSNQFVSAAPLNEERAYFTSTVLGDGRVLICGGFNGFDPGSPVDVTDVRHDYGFLDSTEIFDPVSNTTVPEATLTVRRMMHTATLNAGGDVDFFGGIGNIPPAQFIFSAAVNAGTMSLSPGGTGTFTLPATEIQLPYSITGTIIDGELDFFGTGQIVNAQMSFSSGTVIFSTVTSISLDGLSVFCPVGQTTCGFINIPASNVTGTTFQFLQTQSPAGSPVDLSQFEGGFQSSTTAVIRRMLVSTEEFYLEALNETTANPGSAYPVTQHTATLTVDGDAAIIGGQVYSGVGPSFLVAGNGCGGAGTRCDIGSLKSYSDFAGAGSLNVPRAFHTGTLLSDGTILVAGGEQAPNTPLASAEIYNPLTKTAFLTGAMSVPRSNHTATLELNGRVLVAGGFATAASSAPTNLADIYYPNTQIFEPTAPMNVARANHTATLMSDGTILVVGGQTTSGNFVSSAEVYSSTMVTWSPVAPIGGGAGTPLGYHTATLLQDGRVLVVGGINGAGVSNKVFAWTPGAGAGSWATMAALPTALYEHTSTLLPDGTVLVAGGNNGAGEFSGSFLYNPSLNTWTAAGGLTNPRFGHAATLLPNNTVMLSGGFTTHIPGQTIAQGIEVYHIDESSWVPTGSFSTLRAAHVIILAPNNKLYALGGSNGAIGGSGTTILTSAESGDFSASPDFNETNSIRQSTIASLSATLMLPTTQLVVSGSRFRGGTEASGGGAAAANSAFSFPRLLLHQFGGSGGGANQSDSGFAVDLTTAIYANMALNVATLDTQLTVPTPASPALPFGWYAVRVAANDIHSKSATLQIGPALPTLAPASITGTPLGTSSITWTWSSVAGPIGGYDVYQSSSDVFLGTAPVAGPSFLQGGLQPNTTGSLAVAAYTLSGDGPLIYSATFYTLAAPPTGLSFSSVTASSLNLIWSQSNNAFGTVFEVSMSTDDFVNSFSTPVPSSLQVTNDSTTINALNAATTYYFRLRAFNGNGIPSGFSAVASTVTTSNVSGVVGTALSPTSIQWNWAATSMASYYEVFNSTTGLFITSTTLTTFTDNGLGIDTPRSVSVGAVTGGGLGPLAEGATVYTLANAPGAAVAGITNVSTGSYTVAWLSNGNPPGISYDVVVSAAILGVSTTTTSSLFLNVTGLPPSNISQVTVYALNGDGVLSAPFVVGSTYTFAQPPSLLAVTGTSPTSIGVGWFDNANSTYTFYQVTYSTDDFVTSIATAVPFALGEGISTAVITGLATSTTYWITVQAENSFGDLTSFAGVVSTITSNGGAPPGALGGVLLSTAPSSISGTLGNGESVTLASPSGSFPTDVAVTISSVTNPSALCSGAILGINLAPNPTYVASRGMVLGMSYTIPQLLGISPSQYTILHYLSPGDCLPMITSVNTTAQFFNAEINQFGTYVVAVPTAFTSADTARAYPNPYHIATDGYITFDQIPAGSRVRVMTLTGTTVLDQTASSAGVVVWQATNGRSRNVASGLYLVVIEGGGAKKILKVAIIR